MELCCVSESVVRNISSLRSVTTLSCWSISFKFVSMSNDGACSYQFHRHVHGNAQSVNVCVPQLFSELGFAAIFFRGVSAVAMAPCIGVCAPLGTEEVKK